MARKRKLTWEQRKTLQNVSEGKDAKDHIWGKSQSHHGGFHTTLMSLYAAKLIDGNDIFLTEKGRQALLDGFYLQ